ncbi:uncharacterized protein LOC132718226 isoform X1 [Ruditapes philippinarum]|uniref:uncharacterized protein LOC132718226 isoform X1 n=1 Tax=Ruditapes philippinarum TaxID=129788 RepID=UPI00295A8F58|nr:uncharacterized protein LOC132718226 isoform X1 [Ruditapes philippinarum]
MLKFFFKESEIDLAKCNEHNKTLIKAVLCREHEHHNKVICEDCVNECKCELHKEEKITEFTKYSSSNEIDKKVVEHLSKSHYHKLYLLSKLGRKSEALNKDTSTQQTAANTENEETLLCKAISKAVRLEIRFTKEIMPFIVKEKKTSSEKNVYYWKVKCLLRSLKLTDLEKPGTSTDIEYLEYLKRFEEFIYTNDICVRTADKIIRAYIHDTAKSPLTGKVISRLKKKMNKTNIELTVCEEISYIADEYEPIIVVCLLDTRYDSNICYALSCVKAIDNRRIGFISVHCKSNDARIEDYTEKVTANIDGKNYKDLGTVIDWYEDQNNSQEKFCVDKIISFLERYLPDKGKDFCQSKCANLDDEQPKTETLV